ncbi:hypothetical protein PZ938_17730 [Luteipulveratus sp. YIM 133132]|uniref:hypothetical protein n=1 Tax=Luteipulveratus flavus TaxID=3031728 RepID=UPI0023AF479E|nr:hypothetical protein [Luteipulveratus sp. YIM 133132]MDE9367465.1 hypothetical protein [Luteipulveratus sp. YIM 133132]
MPEAAHWPCAAVGAARKGRLVRIIDLSALPSREIDDFGSAGFRIAGVGHLRQAQIALLTLAPGGSVGRHPAVGDQLLVPLRGSATVSGSDDAPAPLLGGAAVLWTDGEEHETRAAQEGLVALVVEGVLDPAPGLRSTVDEVGRESSEAGN